MAYFGGIFFANMGGGGGRNYFHLSGPSGLKSGPFLENTLFKMGVSVSRYILSTSDFQSEVGEVLGEIGGGTSGREFSSFFCCGKSSEAFSTKTPPQISPSNFTTRFWAVAGPDILKWVQKCGCKNGLEKWVDTHFSDYFKTHFEILAKTHVLASLGGVDLVF